MKHFSTIQIEFLKYADDLSGKIHNEKEYRLTLSELPQETKNVEPTLIQQGIIREVKKNGKVITYARVRMKKEPGLEPKYSLGVKNFPLQQEVETEISKEMFDSFYPNNLDKPQEKNRYTLNNGWEIDVVKNSDEIYAEYEYENKNDIKVPSHWKVKNS